MPTGTVVRLEQEAETAPSPDTIWQMMNLTDLRGLARLIGLGVIGVGVVACDGHFGPAELESGLDGCSSGFLVRLPPQTIVGSSSAINHFQNRP